MKAMVVVAHPDDCVIFAHGFIHAYPELEWTICYLTHQADHHRSKELKAFWDRRNIQTKFLGYVDNSLDIENKTISFNEEDAWIDIQFAIGDQDIIITHNESGEYGHLHHIFVNRATANHPRRITFAGIGSGTDIFTVPKGVYTVEELPIHKDVVTAFHKNGHVNEYTIPDNVKVLLKLIKP